MLLFNMHDKLAAKPADSHGHDILVGNLPLDPAEKPEEGIVGQQVVQVPISEQQDAFLLLVDVVDLD